MTDVAAHVLREIKDLFALAASGARFGCVYADPPWLYTNQATRAATSNHYRRGWRPAITTKNLPEA
jgi:hypothetical protein